MKETGRRAEHTVLILTRPQGIIYYTSTAGVGGVEGLCNRSVIENSVPVTRNYNNVNTKQMNIESSTTTTYGALYVSVKV